MKRLLILIFIFNSLLNFATHNRAGEILYKRMDPKTQVVGGVTVPLYKYQITLVVYTADGTNSSPNNLIADRCADTIYFGDGQFEVVERSNGGSPLCTGCAPCGCANCGEIILDDQGYRVKVNTYVVIHIYPSAGSFTIHMSDGNRNDGIHNMTNSGLQPFYIKSLLVINNFSGANSSPEFHNPPTDKGCVGKCFYHNPAAYDADGDSLSFELAIPLGANGLPVLGYFQPDAGPGGIFDVDRFTGKLTWCAPTLSAEFNIAFMVKEWRKNTTGERELIGYVLRDMQVIVVNCPGNNPPEALLPRDTCVEAGSLVKKNITVSDLVIAPNNPNNNRVTLEGAGGAFSALGPQAVLTNSFNVAPYTAVFTWQTSCDHLRQQPYLTTFKPVDQGPGSPLFNFHTYAIRVVPPSVKNVLSVANGSSIKITWTPTTCNPAHNPLTQYKIYRKNNCDPFIYEPCKTGVDPASGFIYVGKTGPSISSFTDNSGLIVGMNYSYLVIASYDDGAESYGLSQTCVKLKRDVPVLLNVDIISSSLSTGSVYVRWENPPIGSDYLDTLKNTGPYQYILKYSSNPQTGFETVYTSSSPYFLGLAQSFIHKNINTIDGPVTYKIDFIAGSTTVGTSPQASSVFLKTTGADKIMNLNWVGATPWVNYLYTVYRKDLRAAAYYPIGTTIANNFDDTTGITNGESYCYKILAEGKYSDPVILKPLLNFSQESCDVAKDLTPPCSPTISIESDCPTGFVKIIWTDVKKICSEDVIKYNLFYKKTPEENYGLVAALDYYTTSYTFDGLSLISGCYAIQAVDLSGNLSQLSTSFCLDNCPEFELPNIFSPNNDKANDHFKAIKVRQIKSIRLTVFDRWGNLVFQTSDPYFQWEGNSLQSGLPVSEGTFFYMCDVSENRLAGIKKRVLRGYLQVVR